MAVVHSAQKCVWLSIVVILCFCDRTNTCVCWAAYSQYYWSPRLASSHYCQQLTLCVCPDVCLSVCHAPSNCFFFLNGIEPFFGRQFSNVPLYKTLFFNFWFRPLTPKICTKSPVSRLVRQIDRRCLGLPGGFRGWPIQWNHAKCCDPTLVPMATKFGLDTEIQWPTSLLIWNWVVPVGCYLMLCLLCTGDTWSPALPVDADKIWLCPAVKFHDGSWL